MDRHGTRGFNEISYRLDMRSDYGSWWVKPGEPLALQPVPLPAGTGYRAWRSLQRDCGAWIRLDGTGFQVFIDANPNVFGKQVEADQELACLLPVMFDEDALVPERRRAACIERCLPAVEDYIQDMAARPEVHRALAPEETFIPLSGRHGFVVRGDTFESLARLGIGLDRKPPEDLEERYGLAEARLLYRWFSYGYDLVEIREYADLFHDWEEELSLWTTADRHGAPWMLDCIDRLDGRQPALHGLDRTWVADFCRLVRPLTSEQLREVHDSGVQYARWWLWLDGVYETDPNNGARVYEDWEDDPGHEGELLAYLRKWRAVMPIDVAVRFWANDVGLADATDMYQRFGARARLADEFKSRGYVPHLSTGPDEDRVWLDTVPREAGPVLAPDSVSASW